MQLLLLLTLASLRALRYAEGIRSNSLSVYQRAGLPSITFCRLTR